MSAELRERKRSLSTSRYQNGRAKGRDSPKKHNHIKANAADFHSCFRTMALKIFISSNFVGEFLSKQASSEKKGGKGLKAKGKEEESHNCSERRRRRLLSTLGGVESLISSGVLSLTKVASCGLGEGRGEGTHLHGRRDAAACKPSLASKSVRGEGWQLRLGLTRLQWRRREIKERGGKEAKMEENGVGFLLCWKKPPPLSLSCRRCVPGRIPIPCLFPPPPSIVRGLSITSNIGRSKHARFARFFMGHGMIWAQRFSSFSQ